MFNASNLLASRAGLEQTVFITAIQPSCWRWHFLTETITVCWTTLRLCILIAMWQTAAHHAVPADPPKKTGDVATDPAAASRDFTVQGEYSGYISGPQRHRRVGWQIIALGEANVGRPVNPSADGSRNGSSVKAGQTGPRFRAVELAGGLPADGWDGRTRREFDGDWLESYAVFPKCGEHTAMIVGREVWVRDREDGTLLSVLRKVDRESPTLGARPPRGAIVLFDGAPGDGPAGDRRSTDEWKGARVADDGLLMVGPTTKRPVRDFFLHIEFRTPFMPSARGQGRGNSGVYIQQRYEVQILDSFGLPGIDNECGGLYKQRSPDLNMCLPPLAWQTYDIEFRAARFDAAQEVGRLAKPFANGSSIGPTRKSAPARITVVHNGVTIHRNVELTNKTGGGQPEGPQPLPILLQDHGNPVRFRNVWLIQR